MAHHASAKKRHKQSLVRNARNKHWRTRVSNAVRAARSAAESGNDDRAARVATAEMLLRKAGSKGVYHDRTISRTVSRLHRLLNRS